MDELRGDQAVWGFDGESIAIRYETKGWFRSPLLKFLGSLRVPVSAIDTVEFRPGEGRKNGWVMHLRLRERMDPYAAVGAMLDDKAQPFRLTGPAKTELVAEYLVDQMRFAAGQAEAPDPADVTRLVPPLPLHIRTCEGKAGFEGDRLTLAWEGAYAVGLKRKQRRYEYDFADITGIEWTPISGSQGGWGAVRVLIRGDDQEGKAAKPRNDLRSLRTGMDASSTENYHAFLLAATVTAYLWTREPGAGELAAGERARELAAPEPHAPDPQALEARTPEPQAPEPTSAESESPRSESPASGATDDERIFGQIERLGDLHAKGLISDEEFNAKKTELLGRI